VVTAPSIVGGLENTAAVNADNITQASNSSDSASISVSDTSDGPGNIYLPIMVR
jgi:hypothetical protein